MLVDQTIVEFITVMTMSKFQTSFRASAFIAIVSAATISLPAQAFEAAEFINAMKQKAIETNTTISYANLQPISGGLILYDLAVKNADGTNTVNIEELILSGGKELAGGQYSIDKITAVNIRNTNSSDGDTRVLSISDLSGINIEFDLSDSSANGFTFPKIGEMDWDKIKVSEAGAKGNTKLEAPSARLENFRFGDSRSYSLDLFEVPTIKGSLPRDGGDLKIQLEDISLAGFQRFSERGFKADKAKIGKIIAGGVDKKKKRLDVEFNGAKFTNFYWADPFAEGFPLVPPKPLDGQIDSLSMVVDGTEFMGWKSGTIQYSNDGASNNATSNISIDGMFVDLNAIPERRSNQDGLKEIRNLGYDRLVLNIHGKGIWNTKTGDLSIERQRFDVVDAGAIEIRTNLSGYTEQVARQFNKILEEVNEEDDPQKKQFKGMQLLAATSGVAIQNLEISIEDASLLNRVLDLQAKEIGRDPSELAALVSPSIFVMMSPFGVPELTASVAKAMEVFMQGNKTITATAKPNQGLAITEIIGLVSGIQAGNVKPADIVNRLNLDVSAR